MTTTPHTNLATLSGMHLDMAVAELHRVEACQATLDALNLPRGALGAQEARMDLSAATYLLRAACRNLWQASVLPTRTQVAGILRTAHPTATPTTVEIATQLWLDGAPPGQVMAMATTLTRPTTTTEGVHA